jgi:hypothetical protein
MRITEISNYSLSETADFVLALSIGEPKIISWESFIGQIILTSSNIDKLLPKD